jgi:hypothetical protein
VQRKKEDNGMIRKEEDGRAKIGKNNAQSVDHDHGHRMLTTRTLEDAKILGQQDVKVTVEGRRVRKREDEGGWRRLRGDQGKEGKRRNKRSASSPSSPSYLLSRPCRSRRPC